MLDVSFNLVACMAVLVSAVLPECRFEVDGLNSPTAKRSPSGRQEI